MGVLRQIAEYLFLKKKDPSAPPRGRYLRTMHGINRLSIFMFIVAIVILIIKLILKSH